MKDLGARRQLPVVVSLALVTLLALLTFSGCQAVDAQGSKPMGWGLVVSNPRLNFGTVVVGDRQVLTNTITNSTFARLTLTRATLQQTDFSVSGPELPTTLDPGQSASFSVTYTPHAQGTSTGIAFVACSATFFSTAFIVSGTAVNPGTLSVSPAGIALGNVPVGSTQTQLATLSNTGGTNLTITQATVSGKGFNLNGLTLPITLVPAQSASATVSFTPTSGGAQSGSISLQASVVMSVNPIQSWSRRFVPVKFVNTTVTVPVSGSGAETGQLAVNPAIMSLGSVPVGASQTQAGTLTNTGGSTVTVNQAVATGSGFSVNGISAPMTLAPGQSTNFSVKFTPPSSGTSSGNVTIASDAANPSLTVALTGSGMNPGSLAANPASLAFGSVQAGSSQTLPATLTNTGGTSVTVSQASASSAAFSIVGLTLPLTLAPGQSTNFNVAFAPQTAGSAGGNISIISNASNAILAVPLSGSGVTPGFLTASASSLSFGNVLVGSNQSLPETLTNSGGSSVTISQATVTGSSFSVSGLSLPVTLAAGQSTSFNVTFGPQASGAVTGYLAVTSNASNSLGVSLAGTGVTVGTLTASSSSLSFGNVQVSSAQSLPETLTNSGGSSVTISQATVTGTGFSVSGLSLPLTLAAGQSASFNVAFAPQAAGSVTGNISVTSNASNSTLSVSLSGSGVTAGSLGASQPSLSFGNVQVGKNQSLQETLTNSGGSSVTISQATVTGTGFSVSGLSLPLTLAAGQSTSFNVAFAPQTVASATGSISVTSNASNPTLTVSLSGSGVTAGSLSASQPSLSFGNVQVSNSQSLQETLTNSGGSSVTISQATVTGTGFSVSGLSLPLTLAAGQSASFNVAFAPQAAGAVTGYLAVTSNASTSLGVSLSGTGVTAGTLSASSSSLNFGNVQVSNSQSLQETLTNSGGSSVTISQATVTGTGFTVNGLSLPLTLAAGQSASFNVAFAPQAAASATGNISVTSNASNSTLSVSLSGSGVTAGSLGASQPSLSFGNVQVGKNQSLQETLTNSGGSSVTISQATVTGIGFTVNGLSLPLTLAAGQSASFNVTFSPQVGGPASGSISILSNASNATLAISLSGTGLTPGVLAVTSSSLSFGNVQVSATQTLSETASNSGGTSVTISQANVVGSGFAVTGLSLPLTLAPGQSFTFGAAFTPAVSGSASGTLSIVSNASNPTLTVSLTGTGTVSGQLTVSPASLNFGSVTVGQSSSLPASLSASGASVTVSSAMFGTSEFTLSGVTFPLTLAAGQSASFQVVFKPQASGTASDSASFLSNAANSPAVESLGGTGTIPPQHSVSLTWTGGSSDVAGYNIYRSTVSASQGAKINSTLDLNPDFTDSSVQAGQTYYYVTTAVNGSGIESAPSNQVKAVIPTP